MWKLSKSDQAVHHHQKLRDMIQRAGYPGVAADYDQDVVNALMPALEKRARDMDAQPLPAEPTPTTVIQ